VLFQAYDDYMVVLKKHESKEAIEDARLVLLEVIRELRYGN
jgi:hypothetical protein